MKLNVKAFGLSCGLVWGLGLFLLTCWIMIFEGPTGEETIIAKIYRGYNISMVGAFIGLVWAFIDGLIGGLIFAFVYNLLAEKIKQSS